MPSAAQIAEAAAIMREAVRDKSYELMPLGQEVAGYLRMKRKRLTDSSARDYERGLAHLARFFPELELADLEPPIGTQRIEEFLDVEYGSSSPRNYNKNLSILRDFFRYQVIRTRMLGDPTLPIERAKARDVHRETYTPDQIRAIKASAGTLRDRLAVRLILDYGLRKGTLAAVQYKHFDYHRRRLTTFAKGGKVRELPIPDPAFWTDLEQHVLEVAAQPGHYLMAPRRHTPRAGVRYDPTTYLKVHGMHEWWYRDILEPAGIVAAGQRSGERMHKGRHTAGQRVLDATGNLKAVQKLLGHADIGTTGNTYTDWDIDQLAATLASVLEDE